LHALRLQSFVCGKFVLSAGKTELIIHGAATMADIRVSLDACRGIAILMMVIVPSFLLISTLFGIPVRIPFSGPLKYFGFLTTISSSVLQACQHHLKSEKNRGFWRQNPCVFKAAVENFF
jgi:hypothetical protein